MRARKGTTLRRRAQWFIRFTASFQSVLSSRAKEVALYRGAISNPLKRTQEKPDQADGRAEESDGVAGGGDRGGVRPHFSRRR